MGVIVSSRIISLLNMNKNSIILLTKDAFCTEYLPCYGNEYWKGQTPNIDELIAKGTLFTRFYTAAPSSAMAYLAMFTGLYPYEQNVKDYVPLVEYEGETLFDKARKRGLECHVIWDEKWMTTSSIISRKQESFRIFKKNSSHMKRRLLRLKSKKSEFRCQLMGMRISAKRPLR